LGGDPTIFLTFYETFVRGIIDYGSILYANAPDSTLVLLDRIQNQSLRFAFGTSKTTPIPALEYETKIPPVFLRRIHLVVQYVLKKPSTSTSTDATPYQFLKIHNTWKYTKLMSLLSRIIRELCSLKSSVYNKDRYAYMNLTYLEMFYE